MNKIDITNINLAGVQFITKRPMENYKLYTLKTTNGVDIEILTIEVKKFGDHFFCRTVFRDLFDEHVEEIKNICKGVKGIVDKE